jgi:hypothetical protein
MPFGFREGDKYPAKYNTIWKNVGAALAAALINANIEVRKNRL